MSRIFISYRREDSQDVVGRIYDRLTARFGERAVYKDVDDIPLGVDFRDHIAGAVGACAVCLVIIGPEWLTVKDEQGRRRLDSEDDFVRLEIEAALTRDIPVVPVLISGAVMPPKAEVPETLRPLLFRNATRVRPDPDFHRDVDRLIRGVAPHLRPGCMAFRKTLGQWWQKARTAQPPRPEKPRGKPSTAGRLWLRVRPFLTPWRYTWRVKPWTVRDVVIVALVAGMAALGALMMLAGGRAHAVDTKQAWEWYDEGRAHHSAATSYEKVGDLPRARRHYELAVGPYERALNLQPHSRDTLWNVVLCLDKLGRQREADQYRAKLQAAGHSCPARQPALGGGP